MIQYKRIGEMLLESGLITAEQLELALKTKLESNLRFGEVLTALGFVTEDQVTECLANQYGYPVADLAFVTPEPEAVAMIPSITALSGLVLPVRVTDDRFYCIIADPLDVPTTDALLRIAGRPVDICLANPTDLFDVIVKAYGLGPRTLNVQTGKSTFVGTKKEATKPRSKPATTTKRTYKIDPQDDKFALLAAASSLSA